MSRREELTIGRVRVPNSTTANQGSRVAVTLTPVAVAASSATAQTVTVLGVELGDMVFLAIDPIVNSIDATTCLVTAPNTLSIRFVNPTAGALTPTAGLYTFFVIKQ